MIDFLIRRSLYVKLLESENQALKRENRALIDALLLKAGLAPISPELQAEIARTGIVPKQKEPEPTSARRPSVVEIPGIISKLERRSAELARKQGA